MAVVKGVPAASLAYHNPKGVLLDDDSKNSSNRRLGEELHAPTCAEQAEGPETTGEDAGRATGQSGGAGEGGEGGEGEPSPGALSGGGGRSSTGVGSSRFRYHILLAQRWQDN